ncbi:MAG: hypothetical protein JW939_08390 [Candidatus Thermoplasmatota archaeon]|nr:hypothetical protein [Candidatus Thermoplasmatota archaeon]
MTLWDRDNYVIKQKVLAIGRKYLIEDGSGNRIGFCHQKAFKLKEDIRIYTSESMDEELLLIKQEQILDWSGTFAVTDPTTGQRVGYVGRKALKSIFRDTWKVFGPSRNELALVEEGGGALAILRRFIGFLSFVPKTYEFSVNGQIIAQAKQKFQIIGDTWFLTIKDASAVDRRLIVATALMMDIIEQQQGA